MTDLRQAAQRALKALQDLGMKHYENTGEVLYKDVYQALQSALESPTEKTTGNLVHIKLNIMRTALENIAGIRPIVNNLLSDRDIALIALERINSYEQRKN